jgi:hypothetical protein
MTPASRSIPPQTEQLELLDSWQTSCLHHPPLGSESRVGRARLHLLCSKLAQNFVMELSARHVVVRPSTR